MLLMNPSRHQSVSSRSGAPQRAGGTGNKKGSRRTGAKNRSPESAVNFSESKNAKLEDDVVVVRKRRVHQLRRIQGGASEGATHEHAERSAQVTQRKARECDDAKCKHQQHPRVPPKRKTDQDRSSVENQVRGPEPAERCGTEPGGGHRRESVKCRLQRKSTASHAKAESQNDRSESW